jgi:hypothetical protein
MNYCYLFAFLVIVFASLSSVEGQAGAESSKFLPADVMKYPSESIQCYSSLTKPDYRLICPAARAYFCVKEVSTLSQDICGSTIYYGDLYVDGQCQFKKCAAECNDKETINFVHEGESYERTTYCCKDQDYCNSATSNAKVSWIFISLCSIILAFYFNVGM